MMFRQLYKLPIFHLELWLFEIKGNTFCVFLSEDILGAGRYSIYRLLSIAFLSYCVFLDGSLLACMGSRSWWLTMFGITSIFVYAAEQAASVHGSWLGSWGCGNGAGYTCFNRGFDFGARMLFGFVLTGMWCSNTWLSTFLGCASNTCFVIVEAVLLINYYIKLEPQKCG